MTDLEILKLYSESTKIDLPDLRFMLSFAGMQEKEIDDIVNRITPDQLTRLYEKIGNEQTSIKETKESS